MINQYVKLHDGTIKRYKDSARFHIIGHVLHIYDDECNLCTIGLDDIAQIDSKQYKIIFGGEIL